MLRIQKYHRHERVIDGDMKGGCIRISLSFIVLYCNSLDFIVDVGIIIGVVIAVTVFLCCCIGGIIFLCIQNNKQNAQPQTYVHNVEMNI